VFVASLHEARWHQVKVLFESFGIHIYIIYIHFLCFQRLKDTTYFHEKATEFVEKLTHALPAEKSGWEVCLASIFNSKI
jgi:hypothetical protein